MALDNLLLEYLERQEGARRLGEEIAQSGKAIVVCFVDLAGSSELKRSVAPAVWLGYIHQFFERITERLGEGRIVKRIGDELMLVFPSVMSADAFLYALHADSFLSDFPSRVAVDFGVCYFLQFVEGAEDDPYGTVVDRCARIVAKAQAGTILCSESFTNESDNPDSYLDLGNHTLKGLSGPQRLYLYHRATENVSAAYLAPLIESLSSEDRVTEGYRWTSRRLSPAALSWTSESRARPFLLRELLRVPKLAIDGATLLERIKESHLPDAEHEVIGYMVEWSGTLDSFSRHRDFYTMFLTLPAEQYRTAIAAVTITPEMFEVYRSIPKGQLVHVRGIVESVSLNSISLNYAEIVVQ